MPPRIPKFEIIHLAAAGRQTSMAVLYKFNSAACLSTDLCIRSARIPLFSHTHRSTTF